MRSLAKCSSRSNLSSAGGGGSLMIGGKTAADSWGRGHSNAGGMSVRGSCFTPRRENASTVSGIILVSNPKRESLKSFVKFFGRLSDSCGMGRGVTPGVVRLVVLSAGFVYAANVTPLFFLLFATIFVLFTAEPA